jgi:hypothetical protein
MSLKDVRTGMLALEGEHAKWRAAEPGADPEFEAANRQEVYEWITRALCEQEYWKQCCGATSAR